MLKKSGRRGFTLVEVIVVLVILAILAAILIPAMTGWIDKANEQKYIADARLVYTAAQSALSEQYALNPDFADGLQFTRKADTETHPAGSDRYGRVSTYMLYMAQKNKPAESEVDEKIAGEILKYLDSEAGVAKPRYAFSRNTRPGSSDTVNSYYNSTHQPGIIIVYDSTGTVVWMEFGYDNCLVHIDSHGVQTAKGDAKYFSLYRD